MAFINGVSHAIQLDYVPFDGTEVHVTGIGPFDHDHQVLAVAMGVLENCVRFFSSAQPLESTVAFIHKQTQEHFRREEEVMSRLGYSRLDSHVRAHNDMLEWLDASFPLLGKQSAALDRVLLKHLHQWWRNHTQTHDASYSAFLVPRLIETASQRGDVAPGSSRLFQHAP